MNRRAALSGLSPLQDPFSDGDLADLPDLPPVRIPSAVDLLDAATSSPVLQSVTGFVTWLGDGRRLDVDGRLTAADARAVAGALGLGGERPSELAVALGEVCRARPNREGSTRAGQEPPGAARPAH